MTEEQPIGAPKTLGRRVIGALLWVGGFAFGRWAGLSFLFPLALAVGSYFALRKLLAKEQINTIRLIAVQLGHWGWMCLGLFSPGGFALVEGDLVILGGLLTWFGLTRRLAPAYCLLAFQIFGLAMNLSAVSTDSARSQLAALSVHILFRLIAIYLLGCFVVQVRRMKSTNKDVNIAPTVGEL